VYEVHYQGGFGVNTRLFSGELTGFEKLPSALYAYCMHKRLSPSIYAYCISFSAAHSMQRF
jgi:hypothetical protein